MMSGISEVLVNGTFPWASVFPICKVKVLEAFSVFHCLRTGAPTLDALIKKSLCEVNQSFRMSKAPLVFRIVTQQSCCPRSSMAEGRDSKGMGIGRRLHREVVWWVPLSILPVSSCLV